MSITDQQLRVVAAQVLEHAAAGQAKATVTVLAERAGITRPTMYRNHPAVVEDFLGQAAKMRAVRPRANTPKLPADDKLARLRDENEQLKLHLDLYEEHIRRLTTENSRLRTQLESAAALIRLPIRRMD